MRISPQEQEKENQVVKKQRRLKKITLLKPVKSKWFKWLTTDYTCEICNYRIIDESIWRYKCYWYNWDGSPSAQYRYFCLDCTPSKEKVYDTIFGE